jgi:hypothetical protein
MHMCLVKALQAIACGYFVLPMLLREMFLCGDILQAKTVETTETRRRNSGNT